MTSTTPTGDDILYGAARDHLARPIVARSFPGGQPRCTRCGSQCRDADDCDLLLQDRLTDHHD
jgi:hypothetical protein